MTLRVEAGQVIEPGCIAGLEQAVAPVDAFRYLKQPEGSAVQEVSIVRGTGAVFVLRESPSSQSLQLGFGWLGPPNERQETDSVALLADVRSAVLRTCGIDAGTVRASLQCAGSVCKRPEVAALKN